MAAPDALAASPRALATQPDIHGDLIAFVHAEDIFTVPPRGGVAKRITFHEGAERYPKFSPDGKRIAFTADYDGNTDVYIMSTEGGDITRITYHPGSDEVVGWHPSNGKILFRSGREAYGRFTRLYLIAPDGSGLEALPLPEAGWGSFSPDGSQIAFSQGVKASGYEPPSILRVMDSSGKGLATQIVESFHTAYCEAWAPEQYILFAGQPSSASSPHIYTVNPDGTALRRGRWPGITSRRRAVRRRRTSA